jgi:hypothetical protein
MSNQDKGQKIACLPLETVRWILNYHLTVESEDSDNLTEAEKASAKTRSQNPGDSVQKKVCETSGIDLK